MYGQKSPYPRVRQQLRDRCRKPSRRPCSSQPLSEEYANEASSSLPIRETRSRLAEVRLRPV
jgi:hypothetical protein